MPLTGAAAARLYDDHVDAVHALITRRVGPDSSPDIVAETFEHALGTWDRFDQDRGTERLFLFGAAVAVLRRHGDLEREFLRSLTLRSDRRPAVTVVSPLVDPLIDNGGSRPARVVRRETNPGTHAYDQLHDAPSGSELMIAIADLTSDDRDIVLLSLWESCPQAAIAETLDHSVGAVRSALGRIRRELKAATAAAKDRS